LCLHDQSVTLHVIMESGGKWWTWPKFAAKCKGRT
jgi:hypothetical protein